MKLLQITLFLILFVFSAGSLSAEYIDSSQQRVDMLKSQLEENPSSIEVLKKLSEIYLNQTNYPETIRYASLLDSVSRAERDEVGQLYATIYLGQSYLMCEEADKSKAYMERSLKLATKQEDSYALASVYNGLGLYAGIMDQDNYGALTYFIKGLESAKASSNTRLVPILLANISTVYIAKNDITGLQYALEAYQLGHDMKDDYVILGGAMSSAQFYFIKGDMQNALKYIEEAETIVVRNNYQGKLELYTLYGKILSESGKYQEAIRQYMKALLYKEKERMVDELRIKYDTQRSEIALQQSQLLILQKEKRFYLLLFLFVLVAVILLLLFISYRKKHMLYLQIVKKNQEAIQQEKALRQEIANLNRSIPVESEESPEKYTTSSLSEERELELYRSIVKVLEQEEAFRYSDLTKEKLSKILNTNRTYLSQVINKYSGLSYSHFINTFRIKEAVNILSDSSDDTPLKAIAADLGFRSPATFNNAFNAIVGMTPSVYREKIHLLDKKKSRHTFSED